MYPVRVHTKESRIEDRRLRRHDEQQRMLKQRMLEKKLVQARERERQQIMAAQRKQRALEAALAKVRADESAAETEQRRRRRAAEEAAAAARAARRQEEREAELVRQEIEQALVHARWADNRERALRRRALDRHAERVQQVEELDRRRALPEPAAPGEKPLRSTEPCGGRSEPPQARVAAARAGGTGVGGGARPAARSRRWRGCAPRAPRRRALTAAARSATDLRLRSGRSRARRTGHTFYGGEHKQAGAAAQRRGV